MTFGGVASATTETTATAVPVGNVMWRRKMMMAVMSKENFRPSSGHEALGSAGSAPQKERPPTCGTKAAVRVAELQNPPVPNKPASVLLFVKSAGNPDPVSIGTQISDHEKIRQKNAKIEMTMKLRWKKLAKSESHSQNLCKESSNLKFLRAPRRKRRVKICSKPCSIMTNPK